MAKRYVSITLVALLMGLMLAFQFRTTNRVEQGVPYDRAHELTVELKGLSEEQRGLEKEVVDLEAKLSKASKGYKQTKETLQAEVNQAAALAGKTPVAGCGIRVLLSNSPGANPLGGAIFSVEDEDILKLVNELRAAGAEALSVNGQRIVSISEIRMAGSHINVNLQQISPPYEIMAIGDPVTLKSSLEIAGGLVETLRHWGTNVTVESKEKVVVPAYKRALGYDVARPVKEAP